MMSSKTASLRFLIFLLFITGTVGNEWSVIYVKQTSCAVKGSTVFMEAKFTHPADAKVTHRFWAIDPVARVEPTDLCTEAGYSGRVKCLNDEQNHFSVSLSDVKESDQHKYIFRFITDKGGFQGSDIPLTVTDLQVIAPAEVTEGQRSVVLTCKTTCRLTDPTFIWYKDGNELHREISGGNELHLQRISRADVGSYRCAIRGYEQHTSTDHNLSVRRLDPIKKISVSAVPSTEIRESSSVSLTCSTDDNSSEEIYQWFKGMTSVGKEKTFTISKSICEDSGEYECTYSNKHGYQSYGSVTLTVVDLQVIAPAEVTEGESVVLTCKTTCTLTDPTFIWYQNTHGLTTKSSESNNLHLRQVSSEDAGSYNCAIRGYEHLPSSPQNISVRYRPKNVSVSISPSGENLEGSSVTLTCSSDANPPVEIYTWFMGTKSVWKGRTFTIYNITSEDSGTYRCMCSNKVGHQNSTSVTLNVLYPPKNVSISPSGEKVEGSSVTLTCSSDANPPVEIYTWFKEDESAAVGSGQSYTAVQSGQYYCKARNKLSSERSAALTTTINKNPSVGVYAGVVVVAIVCVCVLGVIILCHRKKKRFGSTEDQSVNEDNHYENVKMPGIIPASDSASANPEEALYATVVRHAKDAQSVGACTSACGEDEVQYASVRFIRSGSDSPSNGEDPNVIYSRVK